MRLQTFRAHFLLQKQLPWISWPSLCQITFNSLFWSTGEKKQHSPKETCTFQHQNHNPTFENLFQHSANTLLAFFSFLCLINCSQSSTLLQYLTPSRLQDTKSCWSTHMQLIIVFQRKWKITLHCKQHPWKILYFFYFLELWRIYERPNKYNLLLNHQEGNVTV